MKNLLEACGFDPHSQSMLHQLLQYGPATARTLAEAAGLKRPTAYAALDRLIAEGYVTKRRAEGTTYFSASPRESFAELVKVRAAQKFDSVESASRELKEHLKGLDATPVRQFGGLVVEALESDLGLYRELYESLLVGDYVSIFNPQLSVDKNSRDLLLEFCKRTAKTRPSIREIAVAGPMFDWYRQQIKNPNHLLRTIPKDTPFTTDIILAADTVVFLEYSPKARAAVRIRHRNLYRSFVTLFEAMWLTAAPVGAAKS